MLSELFLNDCGFMIPVFPHCNKIVLYDRIPQYDVKTGMISISPRVDLQKNNGPPPVCKCVKMVSMKSLNNL